MRGWQRALAALAAGAAMLAGAAASAAGAELPCRAVKVIVPWAAGGETDIIVRTVLREAEKHIGPDMAVVNVVGQSGNRGAKLAHEARADGCTLFSGHESMYISKLLGRVEFGYFGFEPVALLTHTPSILGAATDVAYPDLPALVAAARENPQSILMGATLGSTSHLFSLKVEHAADIRFKYVPYEGTRQRITALLAQNIDLGELNIITARKYLEQGSLKAYGIATAERDPNMPELPTLAEQGVDVVHGVNRTLYAPKGTPQERLDLLEQALRETMAAESLRQDLESKGTYVRFRGQEATRAFLRRNMEALDAVSARLGLVE